MPERYRHLSDVELKMRTEELLAVATQVSMELTTQTERLARAIDLFDHDVLTIHRTTEVSTDDR